MAVLHCCGSRLLPHFEYSSVTSEQPVASKHLPLVAGQPWDEGEFQKQDQVHNIHGLLELVYCRSKTLLHGTHVCIVL